MKDKREFEPNPKTPLDSWNKNIDPAMMSGDYWVEEENSPLEQMDWFEGEDCEVAEEKMNPPKSIFMHPTQNVSYGNDSFTGSRPDEEKKKK
ncbi:hypothetical protein ACJ2A9_08565 [Anaerobacillus sp. MEB173]|uniref:hypothetical protein n=1 Tax=Anaerobacillus sp. MEB173 TaxID=3383345 RepID=UPI003F925116